MVIQEESWLISVNSEKKVDYDIRSLIGIEIGEIGCIILLRFKMYSSYNSKGCVEYSSIMINRCLMFIVYLWGSTPNIEGFQAFSSKNLHNDSSNWVFSILPVYDKSIEVLFQIHLHLQLSVEIKRK